MKDFALSSREYLDRLGLEVFCVTQIITLASYFSVVIFLYTKSVRKTSGHSISAMFASQHEELGSAEEVRAISSHA